MAKVVPAVENVLNCVAELLVVRRVLEWFISWGDPRSLFSAPAVSLSNTTLSWA